MEKHTFSTNHGTVQHGPSRTRIENYNKFHKYPLSFHDQVYLIFLDQGVQSLHFEKIRNGLLHRFGTDNVLIGDVSRLRFLYQFEGGDIFTLYLKADDICPLGFNCKKDNSSCQRLHTIIREHVCPNITFSTMWCENRDCELVHFRRPRLRDRILSVILYIYKRHKREYPKLALHDLVISDNEFVTAFSELYQEGPPIPNITALGWKRVIHRYSKYHIDYEQQRQRVDHQYHEHVTYLKLWKTERVENGWRIRMLRGFNFIISRVCKKWMEPGTECAFRPRSFCPYFHFDRNCVALSSGTENWWMSNKWIFRQCHQKEVSNSFLFKSASHFLIGCLPVFDLLTVQFQSCSRSIELVAITETIGCGDGAKTQWTSL